MKKDREARRLRERRAHPPPSSARPLGQTRPVIAHASAGVAAKCALLAAECASARQREEGAGVRTARRDQALSPLPGPPPPAGGTGGARLSGGTDAHQAHHRSPLRLRGHAVDQGARRSRSPAPLHRAQRTVGGLRSLRPSTFAQERHLHLRDHASANKQPSGSARCAGRRVTWADLHPCRLGSATNAGRYASGLTLAGARTQVLSRFQHPPRRRLTPI